MSRHGGVVRLRHTSPRALPALTALVVAVGGCARSGAVEQLATLAVADAGNPTAAVDTRTGARYAAWIETREGVADVYLARMDGDSVLPAVRVNHLRGDAAPHDQAPPQVVAGPDGHVYVAWQNNLKLPGRRFPASNLRFARSLDGGRSFEPAIFVNDDAGATPSSHTFHDMTVTSDGTIYVSWIDGRVRTRAELERATGEHAGAAGHGTHDNTLPGSEVRVTKSVDGGRSFGASVVVAREACPCCRTSVAADADGRVFVSYRLSADNVRSIAVARSLDGGSTFEDPVTVHDDGWVIDGCPHAGASLALDTRGRLHVAWYTGAEQRQGIWYAVSADDGVTFGVPQPVQTGRWVPVSQVKLAADAAGDVWIAWDDRRDEQPTVQLARATRRGVGTALHRERGEHPALAAGTGVVLVWRTREGAARVATLLR